MVVAPSAVGDIIMVQPMTIIIFSTTYGTIEQSW
jgi:hypothetical protein